MVYNIVGSLWNKGMRNLNTKSVFMLRPQERRGVFTAPVMTTCIPKLTTDRNIVTTYAGSVFIQRNASGEQRHLRACYRQVKEAIPAIFIRGVIVKRPPGVTKVN